MSIRHLFPVQSWDFQSGSIISNLPPKEWSLLSAHMVEAQYNKGDILFKEGFYPNGIFFIRKGMAKKYRINKDGQEQIIYVASQGELVGYHAVLAEDRYPDSCALLEDSIVGFIPREDFLKTIDYSPLLSKRLLKTLSHEFAVLANNITFFSQSSVRERTALQLVVLREKYKPMNDKNGPVEITMSRENLSNLVGSARENVVRVLSEFKEAELITTNGRKIIILDVAGLIKIANLR
ncbi:Crp/Fnr family transcriptional regulator [Flavihumibacter sp.]|uniref:Crp/Fnr family transcriptional regulator n=1 Tax=Flavihumibacter sp. TaxID=1913981 RepID=UPI002FC794DC|nr:Crp/Fnr family transcriptional regulator [Flavihumibacter sediminis]